MQQLYVVLRSVSIQFSKILKERIFFIFKNITKLSFQKASFFIVFSALLILIICIYLFF